jgi:RNA polymerase sigma-70 factor, ECF subfamily
MMTPERQRAFVEALPHLRRYARSLTLNLDAADELVQDCLERALSKIHLLRDETRLRAWLFTVMLNIFRNQARRGRRAPRMVGMEEERLPMTSPGIDQAVELKVVLTLLGKLSDDQREALTLVALEEVSYQEAAEILEVPIGTIMSRLSRARERLRIMMDAETPPKRDANDGPARPPSYRRAR